MTTGSLPAANSLDDVIVQIKKTYSNPNVRTITQVVLKDGPRAFRIATLLEVIDPNTKKFLISHKVQQAHLVSLAW